VKPKPIPGIEPGALLKQVRRAGAFSFAAAFSLAATLVAGQPVPYEEMRTVERSIDERIGGFDITDPIEVLGFSRGVHVQDVGVVFTAEVILVRGPATSPFRPSIPPQDIAKLREKKAARLPEVKKLMRDMMVSSATLLKTLPPEEQVVLGLSMFYQRWEDLTGLPHQIVMKAKRQDLLDFERGTLKSLDGAVQVHEY
jgi:hypothetical protein